MKQNNIFFVLGVKELQKEYNISFKQVLRDNRFNHKFIYDLGESIHNNTLLSNHNSNGGKCSFKRKASRFKQEMQFLNSKRAFNSKDKYIKR